jgi:hypothetical protein
LVWDVVVARRWRQGRKRGKKHLPSLSSSSHFATGVFLCSSHPSSVTSLYFSRVRY